MNFRIPTPHAQTVGSRAHGNVHLAAVDPEGRYEEIALCGVPSGPSRSVLGFMSAPCDRCTEGAAERGLITATDHEKAVLNLQRFVGALGRRPEARRTS